MAVTVKNNIGTTSAKNYEYADGIDIAHNDGHLVVSDNRGDAIAIFAPERWQIAEVKN